ncbi:spore coat protein H [Mariprofundus micogutta]|uniref:Spore coat protein H n=1 Tax=Mariprofundus micogutta TaxID=1921010 RepID=A0A1L8CLJ6_9PROT|nr:CotH kinase family protein [Mariprofundus micogutta]GAV19782.1 spore coat protein H [Mariprofundus micogutta]
MADRKSLFVHLAALSMMTVSASAWLFAAEGDVYQMMNSSGLHQSPDDSSDIVATAQRGERATELESKGAWKKVILQSGDVGWTYTSSLDLVPSSLQAKGGQWNDVESRAKQGADSSWAATETDLAGKAASATLAQGDVVVAFDLDEPVVLPVKGLDAVDGEQSVRVIEDAPVETNQTVQSKTAGEVDVAEPVAVEAAAEEVTNTPASQQSVDTIDQSEMTKADQPAESVQLADSADSASEQQVVEVIDQEIMTEAAQPAEPVQLADTAEPVSEQQPLEVINQNVVAEAEPEQSVEQVQLVDTKKDQTAPAQVAEQQPIQTIDQNDSANEVVAEPVEVIAHEAVVEEKPATAEQAAPESAVAPVNETAPVDETSMARVAVDAPAEAVAADEIVETADEPLVEEVASTQEASMLPGDTAGAEEQVVKTTTIRSGPGSLYDVLGWAGTGARIETLEQQGSWLKVRMRDSGRVGWIEADAMHASSEPQMDMVESKPEPMAVETTPLDTQADENEVTVFEAKPEATAPTAETPVEKSVPQTAMNQEVSVTSDPAPVVEVVPQPEPVPTEVAPVTPHSSENGVTVFETSQTTSAKLEPLKAKESTTVVDSQAVAPVKQDIAASPAPEPQAVEVAPQTEAEPVRVTSTAVSPVENKVVAAEVAPPVVQTMTEEPIIDGQKKQLTKTTTIRSAPGALSEMLGWAGSGAMVVILQQQDSWLKVRMADSGRIGWIDSTSVQQVSSVPQQVAATPVSTSPDVKAEVVESKPVEKPVEKPQPVTTEPVAKPEVAPVQMDAAAVPANESPDKNLMRFTRKANLRAGPDAKYDVVTWAGIDAYANQLDSRGDWLKVQMQESKRIGWAYKSSMQLASAATPSTVVANDAQVEVEPVPVIEHKTGPLYFFKQTTNLRAGPDKKYDVVAWGARNESASELQRKGSWSKVRMTLSNRIGWVFNSALVRAETTPVVTVASNKAASKTTPVKQADANSKLYKVTKTSTLRVHAQEQSEINSWVAKGETVAILQSSDGWARVNPQNDGKDAGWMKSELLQEIKPAVQPVSPEHVITKHNVDQYKKRISHGETFNFSYAALEHALYKIPVEELYINMDEGYLDAVFKKGTYDRSEFDIEMRTKGHTLNKTLLGTVNVLGSSTRVFAKKSLLIKLDKEGGRWYGHRRIALRSMASDKAMMREWMAWKLMAAVGMKVPEVHLVRVTFNEGRRVGLYLSIEWMGTNFLAANNMDIRGEFYQPEDSEYCGDLKSTDRLDVCFNKITPQDEDYSSLSDMATAVSQARVDEMHTVLARHFEDESVINWIAVNALVTDGDTYNKNYWLYRDPTANKWTIIPWDYNLTFGRTYDPFTEKPYKIFNDNFQYYYPPDVGVSNPLKDKALTNPRLKYRLMQKIRHLLGLEANGPEDTFGWFSPTVMHARIGNLASVIGKELYKDNFIVYGEDDFRKTYEALMYYVTAHDHFLNKKLFGSYKWTPADPDAAPIFDWPLPTELHGKGVIKAGRDSIYMTDAGWGLFAGHLVLNHPVATRTAVNMKVEGGQKPKYLPSGQSSARCVQRSWVLSVGSGVSTSGDLMVEYLQENSRRTEVPVTVHEDRLELWMNDGNRWKPLKTEVNEYSNTLTARGVPLRSGRNHRFVACSPF